ncbi:transcriptional regulator, GntR family [Fodinibius salinus]|uniref:Transcriptional regulator, GntR family n=1 Tax=Fodinibius salinus TaxID=860790 RepID=A0A5D3YGD7_9BACT|nr:GntR family transcriptional regulator [Fodinibius salinus]TYP92151.1 transcriptional regulator, GntR family [Fodinibius salinus]
MELKEGTPLHKQISDWLKQEIESGALTEDEKLPSENELAQKFDVSRVTVRRALQTLENEQLIYRCQGLGSFVTDQRTHQSFSILNDFTEELAGSGMKASSKVLSFEHENIEGRNNLISYLDIDSQQVALKIERIRLGDSSPIAYDITWMPMFYGQLIEGYELKDTTIFKILEDEFDIPIKRGCYRIEATVADDKLAEHLKVEPQTPLLQINRISYTIGDKPVYFQKRYYRNDKMVFELMAERPSGARKDEESLPFKEFTPVFRDQK